MTASSPAAAPTPDPALPLSGLRGRVLAYGHGSHLRHGAGDLGAEVIKVEPIEGDRTRHLLGAGAGFFPLFNRNKKSIAIDLRHPEGQAAARRLARRPTWCCRTSSRALGEIRAGLRRA